MNVTVFRLVTTLVVVVYVVLVAACCHFEDVFELLNSFVGIYRLALLALPLGGLYWLAWREKFQKALAR